MEPAALTKLLAESPLAAVTALLVLGVLGLFGALMKSHARERATLEKVSTLAAALVPLLTELKTRRARRGDTGAHPVPPKDAP